MDIPSIIDHNYYIVRATRSNRTWICEAERFDGKDSKLYYYYGTYELGSDEHKNNCYLSNSYYDILPSENDEIRLATMEEIDILMDILEENGVVITLQEAKDKAKAPDLKGEDYSNKRFGYKIPDGYEFDTINNGKIILKPIKLKYPETYKECCEIVKVGKEHTLEGEIIRKNNYKIEILESFQKLLICRDAYWKIAGDERGLRKPWEPDLENEEQYCIQNYNKQIIKSKTNTAFNKKLVFPTEEMRDIFYENFKDLIVECKELL